MPAMQGVPNHVANVKIKEALNIFASVFVLPLKRKSQEDHSLIIHFRLKSAMFVQIQFLKISGRNVAPLTPVCPRNRQQIDHTD